MPALNFTVFVDKVVDGTKPHTIRANRLRPFRVGDDLSFFTDMRKAGCRQLRPNAPCTAAVPITIHPNLQVQLGAGSRFYQEGFLSTIQTEELARRDGFENVSDFYRWFGGGKTTFTGQLIEWMP